ncbi:6-phosphogluconolactonase [Methylobacterium sp. 4-46]|uniref:6-phosphogluconolactonase n=1 Tax=unclassified Methylobacterium TaxID=2615210 RepID=UPI000152D30D|nr:MULTISPECIES: 6-phosphogluconolactonase [Methylobacterium]ACA20959.1 6-phosphogluconolactonase [Methylobacterium sp. 4-46]WFT80114.1 6-phosphogluconolactonase [Methylobacterium nodulans]
MAILPPGTEVLPDAEAVARAAAERLVALAAAPGTCRVALAGGSTPRRLYGLLAGPDFRTRLPWGRIHWFFGDERVGPAPEAGSNRRMVEEAFGPDSPLPPGHLHPIPTGPSPEAAAEAYADRLRAAYGGAVLDPARPLFDLVLLGLGEDGHTASLFPGKPELAAEAWVVAVPEAGLAPFVPRVSLTFPALASARLVLVLVTGEGKRAPLARLAAGEDLPAGRVRSAGDLVWLLDAAAAG